MVILKIQNKITDFFMILAWACPFNFVTSIIRSLCYVMHWYLLFIPTGGGIFVIDVVKLISGNFYFILFYK